MVFEEFEEQAEAVGSDGRSFLSFLTSTWELAA